MDIKKYEFRDVRKLIYGIKDLYKDRTSMDGPDAELIYEKFNEVAVLVVRQGFVNRFHPFLALMEELFAFLKEEDPNISDKTIDYFSVKAWGDPCTINGKKYPHLYSYAYRNKPYIGKYAKYLILPMWFLPFAFVFLDFSENGKFFCAILSTIWFVGLVEYKCKDSINYTCVLILSIFAMYGLFAAFEIITTGASAIPSLISLIKWVYIPLIIITIIVGLNRGYSDYLSKKRLLL